MIRWDFLPDEMTDGERAAIADASADGWITPPLYNSLREAPPRAWRTAHLRYLERRRLIAECRKRIDGVFCYRLTAEAMEAYR